jgi:hypothetical protein
VVGCGLYFWGCGVRFVWRLVWLVLWVGFLVLWVGFLVWWSWLWHLKVRFFRGRCDFLLAALRDVWETNGFWSDELLGRVEDLVRFGWGVPR